MNNELIKLKQENIKYRFVLDNQVYVLISFNPDTTKSEELYFAKEDILDGQTIFIRSISSNEEYKKVVRAFEKQMREMEELGNVQN